MVYPWMTILAWRSRIASTRQGLSPASVRSMGVVHARAQDARRSACEPAAIGGGQPSDVQKRVSSRAAARLGVSSPAPVRGERALEPGPAGASSSQARETAAGDRRWTFADGYVWGASLSQTPARCESGLWSVSCWGPSGGRAHPKQQRGRCTAAAAPGARARAPRVEWPSPDCRVRGRSLLLVMARCLPMPAS